MHLHRVTPTWDWANPDGVYLGEDCKAFRATKSRFVGDIRIGSSWQISRASGAGRSVNPIMR